VNTARTFDRAFDRAVFDFAPVIPRMRALARCLCGEREEADTLVKAALTAACLDRHSRNAENSLEVWLLTVVRDQFQSSARGAPLVPPGVPDAARTPEDEALRSSMRRLPRDQLEAVCLLDGARAPEKDAAMICDCTITTLLNRADVAREALWSLFDSGIPATA
jgi:RNA polymerase sigma-70 factor (ECF subfamily)